MKKILFMILSVFVVDIGILIAHDTTHIHPLITAQIAKLIELTDATNKAYTEIYELDPNPLPNIPDGVTQRLYWGTDFDPADYPITGTQGQQEDYLLKLDATRYTRYNNVIDGVVQEDIPSTKVLNHFYQAESGEGMSVVSGLFPYDSSALTAMSYFNQSIRLMSGYDGIEAVAATAGQVDYSAKQYAFFVFGQALHHVEDMSSPTHVHNDVHLVLEQTEKDDYEAWYLPFLKMTAGVNLDAQFTNATTIRAVTNPWTDVWNSQSGSMVKYFYDRTVYRETLYFPLNTAGGFIKPQPPGPPTEELKAMFPCEDDAGAPDTNVPACLHWDEGNLLIPAHWRINAVGDYQHQYFNGSDNSWWPVEVEGNATPVTTSDPRGTFNGVSARYYIEQLSIGNTDGSIYLLGFDRNIAGVPVIPKNVRASFGNAWTGLSTPNNLELRQIYANNLLSPAVEFGAGFTQHWYDIANTPPYLQSVLITQIPSVGGNPIVVYNSSWGNGIKNENVLFTDVTSCDSLHLNCASNVTGFVSLTDSRIQNIESGSLVHINDKQNLTIELSFNEPIKQITRLRIGEFNPGGGCVVVGECRDITPAAPNNGAPPANVVFDAVEGDKIWKITVPTTVLSNLNGKLQLTVKAIDKNNHSDGTDGPGGIDSGVGAELDGTPNTPARRNLSFARGTNGDPTGVNFYPWYVGDGVDVETTPDDAYSYDYTDGDQNHWLVFDTSSPTATININLTLP